MRLLIRFADKIIMAIGIAVAIAFYAVSILMGWY